MAKKLIAGNWKMHGLGEFSRGLLNELIAFDSFREDIDCLVIPPAVYLDSARQILSDAFVKLGAQVVNEHAQGAFTGELSADMLKDVGCDFALVGHSERRQYYGETDERCAAKVAACLDVGLTPILCVGETLSEREAGQTLAVITRQIEAVLSKTSLDKSVVAYEPVWAIGTGKSATPEQAQVVHAALREILGENTTLLYGGSVKASNAKALFSMQDIDGALVGGAALKVQDFLGIYLAMSEQLR